MKQKIFTVATVLFALMFINGGLNKFFNYIPVPPDMPAELVKVNTALMQIGWLMPLIAVVELIGGVLLLIPKFRALGAIIIFPIMIGILLIHATVAVSGLPLAIILAGILVWILWENRTKYLNLIG
ncbi:MAG: DoxX family membrane protein [Sediminibacterium sp.]|uniref:DoxX family membrane protein n=1 Tax=Sediminibacterium sp. TaxID=1917865 RepID=UPI002727DBBD|nr:DoxX family membrane protein [Sediminibacterium sp.]MDO8995989.1 DoxX family membrane protein [Sediminibacterium sp.]